jgi:probable LLM family oxidoreductase
MELGVYTFGDVGPGISPQRRLTQLIEEIELADQVGLDVFGVGEHHRDDYVVSAPTVVLAAGAARTERIRLTSAVTVLSSDDPIRVYQQFATLDLLSGGRAEIMAGRGSFIESFPLFGYDLDDYEQLFTTKLEQLLALRATAMANDRPVYPRPIQEPLPIWVAAGGNPGSAVRAGSLGLPLALAIIGGMPERFKPFADLYRQSAQQAGLDPATLPLSINSHGFIADTSQRAADESFGPFKATMDRIGRERGWPPMSRTQFDASRTLRGANFVGSPQEVIEKILFQYEIFHHDRFLLQFSVGTMPHASIMRSIELFGTEVAPVIRREIPRKSAPITEAAPEREAQTAG